MREPPPQTVNSDNLTRPNKFVAPNTEWKANKTQEQH